MTALLVSVRNAAEAQLALEAGIEFLDVKEPLAGPLGAANPPTWAEIAGAARETLARGAVTLSAACGELRDWPTSETPAADGEAPFALPAEYSLFKLGLSGLGRGAVGDPWSRRWRAAVDTLRAGRSTLRPVAVVYADWETAQAPPPEEVLQCGRELGCRFALVDTFDKAAGSLLQWWTADQLAQFVDAARRLDMQAVAAGSLTIETLPQVLAARPDVVAVRGAVCQGGREGPLSGERVRKLLKRVGQRWP